MYKRQEFLYPCYFGVDVDSRENLIAANHSLEEMRGILGVDSLGFLLSLIHIYTMLGFEVKHIGINTENAEEAMKAAKLFELMFGFDVDVYKRQPRR